MKNALQIAKSSTLLALSISFFGCAPMKSASPETVVDPNSIQGTFQVTKMSLAGKGEQKADAQGIFNDANGKIPAGYQMFEVVSSDSIQAYVISPGTNQILPTVKEAYSRTGNILTVTAADKTTYQLAMTPALDHITIQSDNQGSGMTWIRVKDSVLKKALSALSSEVFNIQYEVKDASGKVIPHNPINLSASKSVTCQRTADGAAVVTWTQDLTQPTADGLSFQINGIADKDFVSKIPPTTVSSSTSTFKVMNRTELQSSLKLTSDFSSGKNGVSCSSFNLSIDKNSGLNLQATCGPLTAATQDGTQYSEMISVDLKCSIQGGQPKTGASPTPGTPAAATPTPTPATSGAATGGGGSGSADSAPAVTAPASPKPATEVPVDVGLSDTQNK